MDFFVLAKLFRFVFQPGNFLVLLLMAGLALAVMRCRRAGMWFIGISAALLFAILVLPVNLWPTRPLENRFPPPSSLDRVDGILVLGGGRSDSLIAAADLLRHYPSARLVFSGGDGFLGGANAQEADRARTVLKQIGVDVERVLFESRSRNTWENLLFTKAVVRPRPDETWLLVTAARHMPRAMGVAQHLKWNMRAWPYDYRTHESAVAFYDSSLSDNLVELEETIHEWVGLLAYRLTGKTDALFPSPSSSQTSSRAGAVIISAAASPSAGSR